MAAFKIVEPQDAKISNRANLPSLGEYGVCEHPESIPVDFGEGIGVKEVKAGCAVDFGDGEIYTLVAPDGWHWERKRGKSKSDTASK